VRLEYSEDVVKNLVKVAEYYKLSTDQGPADGQYNYGQCLASGLGAVNNLVKASEYTSWLRLGAGRTRGKDACGVLVVREMNRNQIGT
jgi:TPR repeat protein